MVAEDSGAIVGVLDLSAEGQIATIDTIGVPPDHQRQGIGTRCWHEHVRVLKT